MARIDKYLTKSELRSISGLTTPRRIQDFLDEEIRYKWEGNRSAVGVLRTGYAHCLDGGFFAVALLERIGYPPLIVELVPDYSVEIDDHVLAVFRKDGLIGAVAKSNCTGLRYRYPIYRTCRELALSYFPFYFGIKSWAMSLRAYTKPINVYDAFGDSWLHDAEAFSPIEQRLQKMKGIPLYAPEVAGEFESVDVYTYMAGSIAVGVI